MCSPLNNTVIPSQNQISAFVLSRHDLFIYSKVKVSEARLLLGPRGVGSKYLVNIKVRKSEKSFVINVETLNLLGHCLYTPTDSCTLTYAKFFQIYSKMKFPEQWMIFILLCIFLLPR
jgi:hypothetical protein